MATVGQRRFTDSETKTGLICKILVQQKDLLRPWELRFVRTLWGNTHMSDKQAQTLMGIWQAVLNQIGYREAVKRYPWLKRDMAERMAAERAQTTGA